MFRKRGARRLTFVLPRLDSIRANLFIETGEQAAEFACVLKIIFDDRRDVGLVEDVIFEPQIVLENVLDQSAEERDVGASAHRRINIGEGGRARETRIGVNDRRAFFFRLHRKTKRDGVRFRHVRSHDHHAIGVRNIPLRRRRRAASE